MQEEFLHHVWKYQKFEVEGVLRTNQGESLEVINTGRYNQQESGPDFFNAKIKIGQQLWAGNVEIHVKSSDWYAHHHQQDQAYDNVILHVVWEDDVEIYRSNQIIIPSFSLKSFVSKQTFENYKRLVGIPSKKINCEKDFGKFDDFTIANWLERMYIERLEDKSKLIMKLLDSSKNNWEEVLFKLLSKNFGLNRNGEAFLNMAEHLPYKVISKHHKSVSELEALFLGTSGLLDIDTEEKYILKLQDYYQYFKHKYQLKTALMRTQFFRLRPDNFPSLRLAQLAGLYHKDSQLFQHIIHLKSKKEIYAFFDIKLSEFWDTHYSLTKISKHKTKRISQSFIDLLVINTIIPFKFCYEKQKSEPKFDELLALISDIKPEQNRKVKVFENLRPKTNTSALESQALLQLKSNYCDKNYCLKCHLGQKLINQSL
jgi:hypothetical protein